MFTEVADYYAVLWVLFIIAFFVRLKSVLSDICTYANHDSLVRVTGEYEHVIRKGRWAVLAIGIRIGDECFAHRLQ
jgi:hypothetical protein